ncbi:hypothetical protein [Pedococcus bigeumensis]|uniref:Uncharacterized protein n=1 Tax=Pedococcus bigeumensis TaxID=433644 RepID=A0A502CZI9_9MICO|nr:hypothetical protein [Pedococcus bigeumensis]TPG18965.1 hypothetical protein EAH86_00015 [Pedococcus bigeumensis]
MLPSSRVRQMESAAWRVESRVSQLVDLSVRGLEQMRLPTGVFAHTLRGVPGPDGPHTLLEGTDLLYDAIVALGAHRLPEDLQQKVLGQPAAPFVTSLLPAALTTDDLGGAALTAWALAEVAGVVSDELFARLGAALAVPSAPLLTVDVAWMLTAAVAAGAAGVARADGGDEGSVGTVRTAARAWLMTSQGDSGLFARAPHGGTPAWRAHVGCFADQVYPVQALARLHAMSGDPGALEAAERCAAAFCSQQGAHGQWWWHYDFRVGTVVERFPVYSVHQHAMAPMALFELADAGGRDRVGEIGLGLDWLRAHPEVFDELVDPGTNVVWRKVGRREPPKLARGVGAVATWARPGATVPGLDRVLPAVVVDHECRPYELGWLLYAWLDPAETTTGPRGEEPRR